MSNKQLGTKIPILEFKRYLELYDCHSHSTYVDGAHSVEDMIEHADSIGLEVYALTEHVRTSAQKWWPQYVEDIKKSRKGRKLKVLIGMEANAIGTHGNVDVTNEMARDAEFVIGSVHGYYHDNNWEKIPDGTLPASVALEYEIEKTLGLCQNKLITTIGHPLKLYEKFYGAVPEEAIRRVVKFAKENGKALELTQFYMKYPEQYLKLYKEYNVFISLGSNAHKKEGLGSLKKTWEAYE
jgi:putative hydrolase